MPRIGSGAVGSIPPVMLFMRAKMAPPPTQVWMPNHPQATSARMMEGTLAPQMPNEARASTGKGTPAGGERRG